MAAYYSRAQSYSRSYNAHEAEESGRMPLTRAIAQVRAEFPCTAKQAKAGLLATWDGEWHHVGKFASEVRYYAPALAIEWLAENRGGDMTPRQIEAARQWHWQQIEARRLARQMVGELDQEELRRQALESELVAQVVRQAEAQALAEARAASLPARRQVAARLAAAVGGTIFDNGQSVEVRTRRFKYNVRISGVAAELWAGGVDAAESARVAAI